MLKRILFLSSFVVFSFGLGVLISDPLARNIDNLRNLSATFFTPSVTADDLKNKFALVPETRSQIRVLIVPGHEPDFGGAEYRDLLERELNLELALKLNKLLSMDGRFEVILSRDENGWNKELESYFANNWESIKSFISVKKEEMQDLILDGRLTKVEGLYHNEAPSDVATRLYGINKWSGERGVDILIHIHLNDHPRSNVSRPGKYWGFAIYVPEKQYSNSKATRHLAEYILKSLSEEFNVSNYPKESAGIIESQTS